MGIQTEVATEVARFIVSRPSPQQIIDFYLSPETVETA